MVERKLTHLFLDTSYLIAVGINDPDFRKVLIHAKEQPKRLHILVPHIAWQEWRTRQLEQALQSVQGLRTAYEKLVSVMGRDGDHLLKGLECPPLVLWSDHELDSYSKKAMQAFAANNGIEVIEIGTDHVDRAWDRYFGVAPPFNSKKSRENRKNDIPDFWILEAAIDLKSQYPNLVAICCDEPLSKALIANGIETYYGRPQEARDITRNFLKQLETELVPPAPTVREVSAELGPVVEPSKEPGLTAVLAEAQREFQKLETRVLGYVTYLERPTKEQLFGLFERSGVSVDMVRNVAERLVLAKLLLDTGNYYLPEDKQAGEQAAALVELEIINLLKGGG